LPSANKFVSAPPPNCGEFLNIELDCSFLGAEPRRNLEERQFEIAPTDFVARAAPDEERRILEIGQVFLYDDRPAAVRNERAGLGGGAHACKDEANRPFPRKFDIGFRNGRTGRTLAGLAGDLSPC